MEWICTKNLQSSYFSSYYNWNRWKKIPLASFGVNFGILNQRQDNNDRNKFLNFEDVKEKVIQEKIEQKTDELLYKLNSVSYLFEKENF